MTLKFFSFRKKLSFRCYLNKAHKVNILQLSHLSLCVCLFMEISPVRNYASGFDIFLTILLQMFLRIYFRYACEYCV